MEYTIHTVKANICVVDWTDWVGWEAAIQKINKDSELTQSGRCCFWRIIGLGLGWDHRS